MSPPVDSVSVSIVVGVFGEVERGEEEVEGVGGGESCSSTVGCERGEGEKRLER